MISNSMDDAISRYDTMNNFPRVMQNLGIATEDSQKSIDKMSEALMGLPNYPRPRRYGSSKVYKC